MGDGEAKNKHLFVLRGRVFARQSRRKRSEEDEEENRRQQTELHVLDLDTDISDIEETQTEPNMAEIGIYKWLRSRRISVGYPDI